MKLSRVRAGKKEVNKTWVALSFCLCICDGVAKSIILAA